MQRQLALAVAGAPRTTVKGRFERHVILETLELTGSQSGGRWGPPGAFSVLYLSRPRQSVVVEAYRHLVDPFAASGMTGEMVAPRRLLTCQVNVREVLDLRTRNALDAVGLSEGDLTSDPSKWDACQAVALVTHQLGLHGIIAPAATGLGETLALFEQHLDAAELPKLVASEIWDKLPPDPRKLRSVEDESTA